MALPPPDLPIDWSRVFEDSPALTEAFGKIDTSIKRAEEVYRWQVEDGQRRREAGEPMQEITIGDREWIAGIGTSGRSV